MGSNHATTQKVLNVSQVAERINYSERRVRELLKQGKLAGTKPAGKWLVEDNQIELFIKGKPDENNQVGNLISTEKADQIKTHDETIFRQADAIINETEIMALLEHLETGFFYQYTEYWKLVQLLRFLYLQSNKYIEPKLSRMCTKFYNALFDLVDLMAMGFIDMDRRLGKDLNDPTIQIMQGPNSFCTLHTGERLEGYRIKRKLLELTPQDSKTYKAYRSAVREILYL